MTKAANTTSFSRVTTWGDFTKQTVRRKRKGRASDPYLIRQDDNVVVVYANELDSLIMALLDVRGKTDG